jgi:23S rRNA (cytosine1962-C5)-methyltransferase
LDQRVNRLAVCRPTHVAHKTVLNAFAYTGGFAIYAAAQEADVIVNIDSSIPALEQAERNMTLNDFQRPQDEYIAGDVFELLRYFREEEHHFDLIILDPPKFVHSQRDLERASRGYKDLNLQALHLIHPGGVLATFSCSGLMSADLFQKILFAAAVDAHRDVQIIQPLGQPADHPILLTFPESAYLKGFLCRIW